MAKLRKYLSDELHQQVSEYLRTVRQVYEMSINKDLDPNHEKVVERFKEKFNVLHNNPDIKLSHTPKIHTIFEHLCQYFKMTNQTLRNTSEAYCETTHQALAASEKTHRLRTRRFLGTKNHLARLLYSTCIFNFVNLGFYQTKETNAETEAEIVPQLEAKPGAEAEIEAEIEAAEEPEAEADPAPHETEAEAETEAVAELKDEDKLVTHLAEHDYCKQFYPLQSKVRQTFS